MKTGFRKGSRATHLYFGDGVVKDDLGGYYAVLFKGEKEPRFILKGHSLLQPCGHKWTDRQLAGVVFYNKIKNAKGAIDKWRIYQNQVE
jgi:hypothetical protein